MQLEAYLERDDRIVLPLGSTEQHAFLSLETDNILAERIAVEAAEPLGVPVLPALAYGLTPGFAAYPGSPTLRIETYVRVVADLLDSLSAQGFRRILVVNGHGGNTPARSRVVEWNAARDDAQALWHDWWSSPEVGGARRFLRSRVVARLVVGELPVDEARRRRRARRGEGAGASAAASHPVAAREAAGDGSFGGRYARPDEEVLEVWRAGVEGARALLESGWLSR